MAVLLHSVQYNKLESSPEHMTLPVPLRFTLTGEA